MLKTKYKYDACNVWRCVGCKAQPVKHRDEIGHFAWTVSKNAGKWEGNAAHNVRKIIVFNGQSVKYRSKINWVFYVRMIFKNAGRKWEKVKFLNESQSTSQSIRCKNRDGQTRSLEDSFAENQKHQRAAKSVCSVNKRSAKIAIFT